MTAAMEDAWPMATVVIGELIISMASMIASPCVTLPPPLFTKTVMGTCNRGGEAPGGVSGRSRVWGGGSGGTAGYVAKLTGYFS